MAAPQPLAQQPQAGPAAGPINPPDASLYVGDLDPEVDERQLFEAFKSAGPILSIRVCRDSLTRRSLGYAYVNFSSRADASRCVQTYNFYKFGNRSCRIMFSKRDPSLRKTGKGNIFIKNLDVTIDNKALYDTFAQFGEILSCKVEHPGSSSGYGFVQYAEGSSADTAIEKVNGMLVKGKQVFVGHFIRRSNRESTGEEKFTNLYVKNFAKTLTEDALKEKFAKCGEITSLYLPANSGIAFVNYKEHDEAVAAIEEFNGLEADWVAEGETLMVTRHQSKAERQKANRQALQDRKKEQSKFANLFIKNLDDNIDDEKLAEGFKPFGDVTSARVMKDSQGQPKGFGFVSYAEKESAEKAIAELHGKIGLSSKPLYVAFAQEKEARRNQMRNARRTEPFYPPGQAAPRGYFPMMPNQNTGMPFMGAHPKWGGNMGPGQFPGMPRGPMRGPAPGMRGQMRGPAMPQQGGMAGRGGGAPFPGGDLSAQRLSSMPPAEQKNYLGERLYQRISNTRPKFAAKITGMLLEMDSAEILSLLENADALETKVIEAMSVLDQYPDDSAPPASN